MNKTLTFSELKNELQNFYGTEHYYKRSVLGVDTGMVYTDGIKYFIDRVNANWFIDVVNSYMPKIKNIDDYFFVINIIVNNKTREALFTVTREVYDDKVEDTIFKKVITQKIPYTDLPINTNDKETIYKFYLIDNVLMLCSEY